MCLVEKYPNARVNLIARRRLVSHKKQQIRGRSTGVTKTASAKGVGRQRPPAGGDSGGAGPRKNGTFRGPECERARREERRRRRRRWAARRRRRLVYLLPTLSGVCIFLTRSPHTLPLRCQTAPITINSFAFNSP